MSVSVEVGYKQIPVKQTAAILTGYALEVAVPFDGYITEVLIHFPDGCNALVDVAVNVNDQRVIPDRATEFIALNDATPVFPSNFKVAAGDKIVVYINNYDGGFVHTISVIVTVKARAK